MAVKELSRNDPKVGQLLELARQRLENGWRRGSAGPWMEPFGAVCLIGSLYAAWWKMADNKERADVSQDWHTPGAPLFRASSLVAACLPNPGRQNIASFNDQFSTTKEDVLAVLNCAIDKARELVPVG